MIILTSLFVLISLLFFLIWQPQNIINIFLHLNPLLTLIQGIFFVLFPLLFGVLGAVRYWTSRFKTAVSSKIFSLWLDRRRTALFLVLTGCIGASAILNSISTLFIQREVIFSLLLVFSWLFVCIAIDGLFLSLRAIDRQAEPRNLVITLRQEIQKAIKKRDMGQFIVFYEMLFLLYRDLATTQDLLSIRASQEEILKTVRTSLDALPKMSLYHENAAEETLLDRLHFFEALAARRLGAITKEMISTHCENGEAVALGSLEGFFQVTTKLFLIFHESHTSLGFLLLNSVRQVVLDSMKKGYTSADIESFTSQFAITISESIKTILDISLRTKQSYISTISKLLILLENVMKEHFRYNRSINPALLMQPFAEIGQQMAYEQYIVLIDRDQILSQLKQIMSQFAILETISERLDIQGAPTDTAASYKEDLPFSGAH